MKNPNLTEIKVLILFLKIEFVKYKSGERCDPQASLIRIIYRFNSNHPYTHKWHKMYKFYKHIHIYTNSLAISFFLCEEQTIS